MAFKFGIIILVASSYIASASALPPCVCGLNIAEVCGSDDITYVNQCSLECAQRSKKDLTLVREGSCDTPLCGCPLIISPPVCGTNGKTYESKCALECDKLTKPNLEVKHEGECETVKVVDISRTTPEATCFCTLEYNPVCGTDSRTYPNKCALECEKKTKSNLEVKHQGQCDTVKVVDISRTTPEATCFCTFEYKPVCGTDSRTYPNKCALECEKKTKSNLEVKHDGECEVNKVVEQPNPRTDLPPCVCTRELKPVCGTDNVTYSNMCLLNCASSKSATKIELKSSSPCKA